MQSPNEGLGLALPGLVLFLAITGVILFQPGPLQTERPPNPNIGDQPFTDQGAPARLWQDPFEAAERHLKSPDRVQQKAATMYSAPSAQPRIAQANQQHCPADEVKLLAVLVDGGPYAESAETRLRYRYAILSALNVSGYLPDDSTHIGYFELASSDLPKLVPFERLSRQDATGSSRRIVILWLNSGAFDVNPIHRMKQLLEAVPEWVVPHDYRCRTVQVIGPADSDGLAALLKEAYSNSNGSKEPPAASSWRLEYHSATATATDASLLVEAFGGQRAEPPAHCANVEDCLGQTIGFQRHIPDDGELAEQLAGELERRGFCRQRTSSLLGSLRCVNKHFHTFIDQSLGGKRDSTGQGLCASPPQGPCGGPPRHIVLVSEWDTSYGRSLPVAVAQALIRKRGDPHAESPEVVGDLQGHPWIHYFSYMRGLDGNISAGDGKDSPNGSGTSSKAGRMGSSTPSIPEHERAEGQAQLDYLRRLATEIEALQDSDGSRLRIFAIGVLGSDLHDKMLILQALRQSFPATLFFTTDLDARLCYASNAPWTRGLIVASGYGLRPAKYDSASSIPPFRVNYQTAVYQAVRQAFPAEAPVPGANGTPISARDSQTPPIELYEIGRGGPIELMTPADLATAPHGSKGDQRQWLAWSMAALFFAATLVGVILMYHGAIHRFLRKHPLVSLASLVLGGVLIAILWGILHAFRLDCPIPYNRVCLEPFSLTSGISAWVPIYLLILALLLTVLFIPVLFIKRRRTIRLIARDYIATPVPEARQAPTPPPNLRDSCVRELEWLRDHLKPMTLLQSIGRGMRRMWEALKRFFVSNATAEERCDRDTAEQVWKRHCRRTGFGWRSLLPLILALSFFFFVMNLFMATGDAGGSALRDPELAGLYMNLRILSTLAMSLLVFLYLDITACARQLIAELGCEGLFWRDEIRGYYARDKLKVDIGFVDRWIILRLVARYADMAVRSVGYPLLVLLLLTAARMPYFDTNVLPFSILVAYIVLAFYLLVSAWLLQRAARGLRGQTLSFYRSQLQELDQMDHRGFARRRQLRGLIRQVETMQDFAFQHFSENPLVKLAILPFGTLGLGLLEVLG